MPAVHPEPPMDNAASLAADFDIVSHDAVPAAVPHGGAYRNQDECIATLRKWLQPTDYLSPGSEYMKHLHAHVPGTGSWLYQSADFKVWLQQSTETPCLHLKGVAGSGKSVLAASTVRHLQQLEPGVPVLFFFFRQIVEKNHSASYLIRDFAAQLLPHSPALVQAIESLSKSSGVDGIEKEILWKAVARALQETHRAFCVIDALDEMDEDDFDFTTTLIDVVTSEAGGVRLLLTSRPLPKIEDALRGPKVLRDRLDASLLFPDVATFVTVSMSTLEPSLSPEIEDRVRDKICERAGGLFLHARLMTEHLTEGLREGRMREEDLPRKLENLPANLIEVYEQMLAEHARRSGVPTEQQASILSCVIHASRPLRLIELGALIARLRGDDNLREGKRLIRASCGRLLEILEDETVSVIHHSFTEFLQNKERRAAAGSFPILDVASGHRMLVLLCLQYLDGSPAVPTDLVDPSTDYIYDDNERKCEKREKHRKETMANLHLEYPLLRYTTQNLKYHVMHVAEDDSEAFQWLDDSLSPDSPAFRMCLLRWQNPYLWRDSTTLHLAILEDLVSYAKHLVTAKPAWIDARDRYGSTPLSYAAAKGHADIATLLLRGGADPKSANDVGLSPLHLAAIGGHVEVAQLLLSHGVSPKIERTKNSPCLSEFWIPDKGRTALQYAMESQKVDLVCLFLSFISADQATEFFHKARNAEVRDAILRTGHAAVNSYCDGKTALFKAAESHDIETMRVLLKHGANANARCSTERFSSEPITLEATYPRGPMPIHAFAGIFERKEIYSQKCEETAKECFKLLIEHGADVQATVDTQHSKNMTALHYAVQKKGDSSSWFDNGSQTELCLAKLLLDAGVNPDAKTDDGRTPLFFANPDGPLIVDFLVNHGADVNVAARNGQTPLLSLVSKSTMGDGLSTELIKKLIEHGADTNASDGKGNNIFHYMFDAFEIFKDSDKSLFELLIKDRLGLNTPNNQGDPPLFRMKLRNLESRKGLLQFLIDKGLDLEAHDASGHTRLWQHINGYVEYDLKSFQLLQDLKADTRALDRNGETLLHAAVRHSLPEMWLKHLVSSGIDPKLKTKDGLSPVHILLERAEVDETAFNTIDLFSEMGINADEAAPNGRTPLHIASLRQHEYDPSTELGKMTWIEAVLDTSIFGQSDINAVDSQGLTPLHLAASMSEYNVARLLKAGANPTILAHDGISALHVACRTHRADVACVLLVCYQRLGVLRKYIDMTDNVPQVSFTPLHLACRSGCAESVSLLLQYGANPAALDGHGRTALHIVAEHWPKTAREATSRDRVFWKTTADVFDDVGMETAEKVKPDILTEIINLLCSAGARLDARTPDGMTPEDIARANTHDELVRILSWDQRLGSPMEDVGDPEISDVVQILLEIEDKENLPRELFRASQHHGPEVIFEFSRAGGDVYVLDRFGDRTVLHMLVEEGQPHQLRYFLAELAEVDKISRARRVQQKLEDQRAKRMNVTARDQTDDIFEQLPDEDVNDHDAGGPGTVLGAACGRDLPSLDMIKLLVEEVGLDVNTASHLRGYRYKIKKATPLHILACGTHHWQIEALRYLLSKGADIEARNSKDMTPLLVAISSEYPSGFWKEEIVRCLLEHGAEVDTVLLRSHFTTFGKSGHVGVARALLEHGIDLSCIPNALGSAVDNGNIELVRVLLDTGADVNSIGYATGEMHEPCWNCRQAAESEVDKESEAPWEHMYLIHAAAIHLPAKDPTLKMWAQKRDVIIAALLAHGADTSLTYGEDGTFVLQRIVEEHGRVALILKEMKQQEIERRGGGGRTLLMSSCIASIPPHRDCYDDPTELTVHIEAANLLLDAGAHTDVVDDVGRTALHWLCTMTRLFDEAHQQLFGRLITVGSSVVEIADRNGDTPLHLCLKNRQFWAAEKLMEHVVSFSGMTRGGNNMLHLLAREMVGHEGKARAAGDLFKRILKIGIDVDAHNEYGESPLFVLMKTPWAILPDHVRGNYLDTDARDHALVHNVFHRDALQLFLDAGADLYTTNAEGSTLLHAVAGQSVNYDDYYSPQRKDLSDVFAGLLELGLDPRQEDNKMRTALDLATARGWDEIMGLFSDQGRESLREKWKKWEEMR